MGSDPAGLTPLSSPLSSLYFPDEELKQQWLEKLQGFHFESNDLAVNKNTSLCL